MEDESPQVCSIAPQADIGLGLMGGPLHICLSRVILSKLKKTTTFETLTMTPFLIHVRSKVPLEHQPMAPIISYKVLLMRNLLIAPGQC